MVVSVDIKDNRILTNSQKIRSLDFFSIIEKIVHKGIKTIILLDLSKVGSKSGVFNKNYDVIRRKYPDLEILIGGGVKNLNDILLLKKLGMNGVLIATVLHEGLIDLEEIRNINIP